MSQDLDALGTRIVDLLSVQHGITAHVHSVRPLIGGACQDNFKVEIEIERGDEPGRYTLALRSDARSSLEGSIGRRDEYAVIAAAIGQRVPTARARWLLHDLLRPDAWAYFLDWVPGEAIGRRVVRLAEDPAFRSRLTVQTATALAAIHRVRPETHPHLSMPSTPDPHEDPVARALRDARGAIGRLPEPHPALELALDWLEHNRPPVRDTVLVHGDFRTGNFMVTSEGLSAVLDWEFARWGPAEEDIGWLCVRDWRFGRLDRAAGGFATRADFYEAYEAASGRPLDRRAVHFWEVLGNVRWATGSVQQGERYLSGAERDLELIAIGRRAAEMEFEALRLIEQGV